MRQNPSEKYLIDACLKYLTAKGCYVWRQNTGRAVFGSPGQRMRYVSFGRRGVSDILGWTPDGHGIAVECKRPMNEPTPEQLDFIMELIKRGGFACLAYSIEDLQNDWERYASRL